MQSEPWEQKVAQGPKKGGPKKIENPPGFSFVSNEMSGGLLLYRK